MPLLKLRYLVPAACAFVASAMFAAPQSAQAIPLAPAPSLDSRIDYVQQRNQGARRAVRPATRPPAARAARPGVRPPVVRPGRPGVRPPVVRPGRPGVRPPVVRPGRPGHYGNWRRSYRWRPGSAIAAGAAIGFLGAAAAASYYGQPPEPGLCWYYTNPSRTAGFWDVCPY